MGYELKHNVIAQSKATPYPTTPKELLCPTHAQIANLKNIVDGVQTNIDFQLELIKNPDFRSGCYDNGYLNRYMEKRHKN